MGRLHVFDIWVGYVRVVHEFGAWASSICCVRSVVEFGCEGCLVRYVRFVISEDARGTCGWCMHSVHAFGTCVRYMGAVQEFGTGYRFVSWVRSLSPFGGCIDRPLRCSKNNSIAPSSYFRHPARYFVRVVGSAYHALRFGSVVLSFGSSVWFVRSIHRFELFRLDSTRMLIYRFVRLSMIAAVHAESCRGDRILSRIPNRYVNTGSCRDC